MATAKKQAVLLRRRRSSWQTRTEKIHFEPEHLLSTNGAPLPLRTVRQLMNAVPRALCRVIVESVDGRRNHAAGLISSGTGMLVKLPSLNNEDGGRHYCGLLTNNHVLDENSVRQRRWRLVFDETGARIDPDNPKLGPVLFGSSRTLDFTFLYLPECKLFKSEDYLPVAPERNGMRVVVVQHPNGGEMSLSYGEVIGLSGPDLYHTADTMGGSSGSPLLDEFGRVVGLHKAGSPLTNVATRMTYITQALAQSSDLMTDFRRHGGSDKREQKSLMDDIHERPDYRRPHSPPPPYSPGPAPPPSMPLAPPHPPLLHGNHAPIVYRYRGGGGWRFKSGGRKNGVADDMNLKTLLVYQFPHGVTTGGGGYGNGFGRPSNMRDLEMFEYELSRLALANRLLLPRLKQGGCLLLANKDYHSQTKISNHSDDEGERVDDDGLESDSDQAEVLERATMMRRRMSRCQRRSHY